MKLNRKNQSLFEDLLVKIGFQREGIDTYRFQKINGKKKTMIEVNSQRPDYSVIGIYYDFTGGFEKIYTFNIPKIFDLDWNKKTMVNEIIVDIFDVIENFESVWDREDSKMFFEKQQMHRKIDDASLKFREHTSFDLEVGYSNKNILKFCDGINDNKEVYLALIENEEFIKTAKKLNDIVKSFIAVERL